MKDVGVGGLVRSAAWLDYTAGMEVLSIGRSVTDKEDCVLEIVGTQMLVRVAIANAWIWIYASSLDQGEPPEFLFNVGDGPAGWVTVRAFVAALERSGLTSLKERPIHLGPENGPNTFVIA